MHISQLVLYELLYDVSKSLLLRSLTIDELVTGLFNFRQKSSDRSFFARLILTKCTKSVNFSKGCIIAICSIKLASRLVDEPKWVDLLVKGGFLSDMRISKCSTNMFSSFLPGMERQLSALKRSKAEMLLAYLRSGLRHWTWRHPGSQHGVSSSSFFMRYIFHRTYGSWSSECKISLIWKSLLKWNK